MDHLTWLMLLQEPDGQAVWPAFPEEMARGVRQQADGQTLAAAAEALAAAWERSRAAEEQAFMWEQAAQHRLQPRPAEAVRAGTTAGEARPYGDFWREDDHVPVLRQGGRPDMEEISRFFERDARRF